LMSPAMIRPLSSTRSNTSARFADEPCRLCHKLVSFRLCHRLVSFMSSCMCVLRSRTEAPPLSLGQAVEDLVLALIELLGADQPLVELPGELNQLSTDRCWAVVVAGGGVDHLVDGPQREARRGQREQQKLCQQSHRLRPTRTPLRRRSCTAA